MQDPEFQVEQEPMNRHTLAVPVSPLGAPSSYPNLATPSGQPFHGVPEDYDGPHDGCSVCFLRVEPTVTAAAGLNAFANVRHRGTDNTLVLVAGRAWYERLRSEEAALAVLRDALPFVPTTWLEEAALAVATLHDGDSAARLRCVRAPPCQSLCCVLRCVLRTPAGLV